MKRIKFNAGWDFSLGKAGQSVPGARDSWETVDLPHDFIIHTDTSADAVAGPATGYYGGGIGHYSKKVDLPEEWRGKKVVAEFDGVYNIATVGLNGNQIEMHPYGYSPFHVDLTPHLKFGVTNRLHVAANNANQPNSRWYSGGGIYRSVDLLISPLTYIVPWGIFAYTERVEDGKAYVSCEVTVANETDESKKLQVLVAIAPEGGDAVVTGHKAIHAVSGKRQTVKINFVVPEARLWDIDDPFLYNISAVLSGEDGELDGDSTTFGIRTISVDAKNGFRLNGRELKLKGGCVHHDNGLMGSVSLYDSEYRKMKHHKENGYNAIRCAHNPPSRDMLDACDRLGLLVMNEAFDMWRIAKSTNDYHLFFEAWWRSDMEAFMTRDRNHPSIVMWSTGNEIMERGGLAGGYELARELADYARKIDPTRPITNGLCSMWSGLNDFDSAKMQEEMRKAAEGGGTVQNMNAGFMDKIWGDLTDAFAAPLDVVGYNYLENRYESDADEYPDRVICGTESVPMAIDRIWNAVEKCPHVIGDFNWTSYDYIGEAGLGKSIFTEADEQLGFAAMSSHGSPYPWKLANSSDFDICGNGRPQLYYRKIVWGSDETYIAVQNPVHFGKKENVSYWGWPERTNSWTWDGYEGKDVTVDVYSAADEVELLLNGKRVGLEKAGKANRFTAKFVVTYEPGELVAVSLTGGKELSRIALKTTGKPVAVKALHYKDTLNANGEALSYAAFEIVDADGNRVPYAAIPSKASVSGAAALAAFGNGNPKTDGNYTKGEFTSYQGRLMAVVRSGYEKGSADLLVECEGLDPVKVQFNITD